MRAKKGFVGNTEVYFTICSKVYIDFIVIDGDMRKLIMRNSHKNVRERCLFE